VKALHLLIARIEPREGSRKAMTGGWLWTICPVGRAVSEWPLFAHSGRLVSTTSGGRIAASGARQSLFVLIPEEAAPQFLDDAAPRNGMMPPPNSEMMSPPITE
jgi:hypothetical protein